jgi:acetylornithine deacetylase/succinyl-diaminopimelate desuccinylase-like protein
MSRISELAASLESIRAEISAERVLAEALAIQQIPSPTFDEGQRAIYVQDRFRAAGLDFIEIDAVHNVYGCLRSKHPGRAGVLVSAHTDTVFDRQTSLTVNRQNGHVIAPGIGDNSLGVAGLLALMDLLCAHRDRLTADIWFVANSREEGLGDLGGIKAVHQKLSAQIACALVIEGMAYGRIYHAGIAVRRLEIRCQTPGGHSWLHFGHPSAIHALVRLAAQITTLQPPDSPRTTYNIGVIEGGQSVNTIAAEASLLLDLRSEDRDTLATLERTVMNMIENSRQPDVNFSVKIVGDRPAGAIPLNHPLVMMGREVLTTLGVAPIFEAGSTDANVPLSAGTPTIVIGITHGGNAHRLDEYIETAYIADGVWQLLLLTLGASPS